LGLALVNVLGVRWGGLLQLLITAVKVGSLLVFMALPFLVMGLRHATDPPTPSAQYLMPAWPAAADQYSFRSLAAALLGVLWAYHGWMNIGPVAEEIRQPQRNIPLALLGGVGIVIALYLGTNVAYYLVLPQPEMAEVPGTTTVAAVFSQRLLGPIGAAVASGAVMASVFGALNGNLLVGPRVLYALGEDGLAPRAFGQASSRFHTPALAILALAGWTCLLILAAAGLTQIQLPVISLGSWQLDLNLPPGKPLFDVMTDFAMFGAVVFETLAVATVFPLRRKWPDAERPYRCWGYPLVPALYILIMSSVLVSMFLNQRTEASVGVAFIALGALVYFRRRSH
jgi:amino acid transporter